MRIVRGRAVDAEVKKLAARGAQMSAAARAKVRRIIADVRENGDRALRNYARQWDGLQPRQTLRVSAAELRDALASVSPEFRGALEAAAGNIRTFCEWQRPQEFCRELQPGVRVGQVVRPLRSVGCYVPGGRFPLPSSLLMTVIPAQVAGVPHITVASPRPAKETLAAAGLLGVTDFFRIGGAQAIAALAYGTRSVERVGKIVGPGNAFVTEAKKQVAFDCAIDFLAGPTEAVIVAHEGNPAFIAADLVAQAEHDPQTTALLVTTSGDLARAVATEVKRRARGNRNAEQSLSVRGVILVTQSREVAMVIANQLAPEHITVAPEDVSAVTSAGSIFAGPWSAQPLGDYVSGPNHVLPTGGMASVRGGLSVLDFLKIITVQEVSPAGVRRIGPLAETLARAEGLAAHAEAVRVRCAHA